MPMFYFDVQDGNNIFTDEKGHWCRDAEQAQQDALQVLKEVLLETDQKHATLVVRDGSGNTLVEADAALRLRLRRPERP
jgi:hypothetical protein